MARGVNKVILIGNLGQDPESKQLPSGGTVTNISIATSESWKDKTTGQPVEKTEWHRVVFFNRLAEIVAEFLKQGSKVYIEGSLRTRKWQAQDGTDRYSTEVVAGEMQMLDSHHNADNHGAAPAQAAQRQPQQQQQNNATRQQPVNQPPPAGFDSFDDDIPF